ncbi:MAG: YciI family protein [Caulobacteraceae bacterium]
MLYAFLAYHAEGVIDALTAEQDQALMEELHRVHDRLLAEGHLGPAARLGATRSARTVRPRSPVMDGPFAETKEQLLGFYVMDFPSLDDAVAAAQALNAANPSAVYEIRPIELYLPGKPIDGPVSS